MLPRVRPGDTALSAGHLNALSESAEIVARAVSSRGSAPGMSGLFTLFAQTPPLLALIPGKITARTTGSAALPPAVLYQAESTPIPYWRITTNSAPLFRAPNDVAQITPAAIGSPCLLQITPKTNAAGFDVAIAIAYGERINFAACSTSLAFTFNPGDGQFSGDDMMVSEGGDVVSDEAGNVVTVESSTGLYPADTIVTSDGGEVITAADYGVVTADQPSPLVDPDYFAAMLPVSSAGDVVTGERQRIIEAADALDPTPPDVL